MQRRCRHAGLLIMALCFVFTVGHAKVEASMAKPDTPEFDAASRDAAQRRLPLLIDFHAPWCYSCYYMSQQVLVGPRWRDIERRAVVLQLDADSPEGAYWKAQWTVKALPAYVLLKSQPDKPVIELGRILGEQTADDFYGGLNRLLARASSLPDLQARAAKGGPSGLKAVREALQTYRLRGDAAGLDWYRHLYGPLRSLYDSDAMVSRQVARLELLRASQKPDAAACQQIAPRVLAADLGCERPYEISRWRECAAPLPVAQRQPLIEQQLKPMQALVDQQVFGKGRRCADQRSAVLGLAEMLRDLGRKSESDALLRKAAVDVERRIGERLATDRNAADNWRVYLEQVDDQPALDRLYPRLIAAYPGDYVYAFRYGRSLLARGDAPRALPYLEQAAQQAYGQNRLKVAEQRVKALLDLDRDSEARAVAGEALRANGPWFAEDVAKLKAALPRSP